VKWNAIPCHYVSQAGQLHRSITLATDCVCACGKVLCNILSGSVPTRQLVVGIRKTKAVLSSEP